jgi:PAS domain S-box-containing protein
MFLAFGTFIIACGGTHFMEAITLWRPVYWISAYVKVVTAVASVATAIALPVVMPTILKNIESWRLSEARAAQLVTANHELSAANEKLQELDRLRRRFVAQTAANIGDWEWDIRTGVIRWAPELDDMHGLARGGFRGTFDAWAATIHPDDRERAVAVVQASLADRTEYDNEYRTIRPDGGFNWVVSRGAVEYSGPGEPVRMSGMCMDISSRKRTEEALRRTEKLAAAGRLAATIAHEINNPLEAVTNLIYLAKLEDPPASCQQVLDMADRELQRIGHITRRTLGFYREDSSPVQLDVSEILRSVIDILEGKLESRRVSVRIEADNPVYAYGVAGELRQVFANLIANAVDASPAGSQIRIRLKQAGKRAQVTIADQGSGIREDVRAQIFEPFFTTKKDVGTGLGLWVSKQILEKHCGQIRFRSQTGPGKSGTVFLVQINQEESARTTAA